MFKQTISLLHYRKHNQAAGTPEASAATVPREIKIELAKPNTASFGSATLQPTVSHLPRLTQIISLFFCLNTTSLSNMGYHQCYRFRSY